MMTLNAAQRAGSTPSNAVASIRCPVEETGMNYCDPFDDPENDRDDDNWHALGPLLHGADGGAPA